MVVKPINAFYKSDPYTAKSTVRHCRECRGKLAHEVQRRRGKAILTDEERITRKRAMQLRSNLQFFYGITVEQYNAMVDNQKNLCAICGNPETARYKNGNIRRLAVDHDKETGRIRGLLCGACNPGIGFFQHDPTLLTKAIEYLNKTNSAGGKGEVAA